MHSRSSIRIRVWLLGGTLALLALAALGGLSLHRQIHQYDALIVAAGKQYGVDACLVWSVIWHESHFSASRRGTHGELGLMQVTEAAAHEWARASGTIGFKRIDLLKPEVNISAGAWYLSRALKFWAHKRRPVPYALAEYNAGRSNTIRWSMADGDDDRMFESQISYPGTRRYVQDILKVYRWTSTHGLGP